VEPTTHGTGSVSQRRPSGQNDEADQLPNIVELKMGE